MGCPPGGSATKIMSHQSISDLNSAIASLADWGQKISSKFVELKMKKFRKSMKHKYIYFIFAGKVSIFIGKSLHYMQV